MLLPFIMCLATQTNVVKAKAQSKITLAWKPQLGVTLYDFTAETFENKGDEGLKSKWSFSRVDREEVVSLSDGIITTEGSFHVKLVKSLQDYRLIGDEISEAGRKKSKANGTPVQGGYHGADSLFWDVGLQELRLTELVFPKEPVAIGGTWSSTTEFTDDARGTEVNYKLEAEEKVGPWQTYRITFKGRETSGEQPMRSDGTFWIEKSTGSVIRKQVHIVDTHQPWWSEMKIDFMRQLPDKAM